MNDKLNDIEKFFEYDLTVKKLLVECYPNSYLKGNIDGLNDYSDRLEKSIKEIKYCINYMMDFAKYYDFDKKSVNDFFNNLEREFYNTELNYDAYSKFYNKYLANMREKFVSKLGNETYAYGAFNNQVRLSSATSVNELLHIIHMSVTNTEYLYDDIPKLEEDVVDKFTSNVLYGKENELASDIFHEVCKKANKGFTMELSLDNKILIISRNYGHALSVEITKIDNDRYSVDYFIPKITNYELASKLRGINRLDENNRYGTGSFECSGSELADVVSDFISKVPTDDDIPRYQDLLKGSR